jgi:hypothetical protein
VYPPKGLPSLDSDMIDLNTVDIEPSVLNLISKRSALELTIIPIALKNDIVIVAVPQLFRRRLLTDVRFILGRKKRVKPVSASRDSIVAAIHRFYGPTEN